MGVCICVCMWVYVYVYVLCISGDTEEKRIIEGVW
jgi:hypothetical protein